MLERKYERQLGKGLRQYVMVSAAVTRTRRSVQCGSKAKNSLGCTDDDKVARNKKACLLRHHGKA